MSASWAERNVVNRAVRLGTRLGRDIDGIRELETRGRRSGRPRRVPVKVLELGGERYVVSLYGDSGWARNLRVQPAARLRFGRQVEDVIATEVPGDEVTAAYRAEAGREETRRRLEQGPPVFRLTSASARG